MGTRPRKKAIWTCIHVFLNIWYPSNNCWKLNSRLRWLSFHGIENNPNDFNYPNTRSKSLIPQMTVENGKNSTPRAPLPPRFAGGWCTWLQWACRHLINISRVSRVSWNWVNRFSTDSRLSRIRRISRVGKISCAIILVQLSIMILYECSSLICHFGLLGNQDFRFFELLILVGQFGLLVLWRTYP